MALYKDTVTEAEKGKEEAKQEQERSMESLEKETVPD